MKIDLFACASRPMSPIQIFSTICVLNLLIVCTALSSLLTVLAAGSCHLNSSFTPNFTSDKEKADLKVLVPNITTLRQFVDCSDPTRPRGFSIDVFQMALSILPGSLSNMSIHYTCFNFSSVPSATGPTYDDMVKFVENGMYDAVVGDVTIGAHRLSRVDFTQQYMESGVVILIKVAPKPFSPWLLFAWPFSFRMWCTIVGAFAVTGLLVCFLEFSHHPEFIHDHVMHRIEKIFWFMINALVLLEKESIKSSGARLVMVAWVFFVILLSASYTAGLSSFLTANSLSPPTQDIISLRESGKKLGYRRGSIVEDYLTTRFHIPDSQLKPIRTFSEFVKNITNGPDKDGVLAIVDELPYVNILFSNLSSSTCDFAITGPPLTSEGFGFGLNKERNLAATFSVAILNLTESGCLQNLQDSYNMTKPSACSSSNTYSAQVTWRSSLTLFIPFAVTLSLCIFLHFVKRCLRSHHTLRNEGPSVIDDDSTSFMLRDIIHRHQHAEAELHQWS